MRSLSILPLTVATALALVTPNRPPIVSLPYSTFQGTTSGNLTQFLGVPFAAPPINELRFKRPQPPLQKSGIQKADAFGAACPQQTFATVPLLAFPPSNYSSISEDCLTLNIIKPTVGTTAKRLPVALWIHGGGFETGDSTDPKSFALVERSIAIGQPFILVTANYRLSALGFLGGKEILADGSANLGIHDQIMALQWIQNFISSFGGDPTKVTLFGVNAGAISVATHMLKNGDKPNPMFRGAFMLSGGPSWISHVNDGQEAYDQLVLDTGCNSSNNTLQCLRQVPYDALMASVMKSKGLFSFSGLANEWKPRVDDDIIKESPYCAVSKGLYAKVPIISGSCDDEGTMFGLVTPNITTDPEFVEYMQTYLLRDTTPAQIRAVQKAYPSNPAAGSPFDTGRNDTLTPEYKRLSSIEGDFIFQAPRRFLLESAAKRQKTWGYIYKRGKSTPNLGAFHGIDLADWFANKSLDFVAPDSLIRFIINLNPNPTKGPEIWPEWGSSKKSPPMLTFSDPAEVSVTPDTYRSEGFDLLSDINIYLAKKAGICN